MSVRFLTCTIFQFEGLAEIFVSRENCTANFENENFDSLRGAFLPNFTQIHISAKVDHWQKMPFENFVLIISD